MSRLSSEEKRWLLRLARQSIEASVCGKPMDVPPAIPSALRQPAGAFVTLHKKARLRGCLGYVLATKPLYQTVMEAAAAAALQDPRFGPVRAAELPELDVEISVLSPIREVRPEQVEVGTHGLMVTQERQRGLLLPQVALEHHWGRAEFLEETCRKAGLPSDAWQHGAKIEAFTAEVFGEQSADSR